MLTTYSMKKADRNYLKFLEKKNQIIKEVKDILNTLAADLLPKFSIEKYIAMFTRHNDGDKLENLRSISTSPLLNQLCIERSSIPGLVCNHCYSVNYNNLRRSLREKLERNTAILTTQIIEYDLIPTIIDRYFRIESFGDLQNATQAINYLNFILKNPDTMFAWWTKNPQYIKKALDQLNIEKPENVQIVFSSPCINKPADIARLKKIYPFIDKTFTVYDKKTTETINCGSLHCINCLNCYKPGGVTEVKELLK